ncbi:MAG: MFS transporter [Anaerolineales bacterium]
MADTATARSSSPLAIFRNRDFSLIWTGQLVSTIGNALTSLAASILVFRLTGSAMSVGLMLMATAAPTLFVGLIAGVFVDRFDRKRIMIAADIIRAVLVFLIPVLIPYNIAWLYIIVMLTSAIGQFFDPAHASVLPEVASDQELAAANSFIAISGFGSTAIGYAASGLIASRFPIEWAFYLDTLTFIISAVCIGFIHIKPLEVAGRTTVAVVFSNLKDGARFILDSPILRSLAYLSVPALLGAGLWNTLLLPFAERALGATEFEYGLQEGLTSVGFVAASLIMARWADRLREGQWVVIGFLGVGIVGMIYSQVTWIPLAIALVTVSGFANAPSAIARKLLIQRNTTREVRGRVSSVFFVTRDVVFLLGMGAAGLADLAGVRWMVLLSSILIACSGLLAVILPGLGQPTQEWLRGLRLLRAVTRPAEKTAGRAATPADFEALLRHIPLLSVLTPEERLQFIRSAQTHEYARESSVIQKGDRGDEVYFILAGRAVAGVTDDAGQVRSLSSMGPGDFFGEIAALRGLERTADVAAEEPLTVLQVPAEMVRSLMHHPRLNYLFTSKMTERLSRTHTADLPRLMGWDQETLLELRTPAEGGWSDSQADF